MSADAVLYPDGACPSCGGKELYEIVRDLGGEWLDVRVCRSCASGAPLVRLLDLAVEDVFAE